MKILDDVHHLMQQSFIEECGHLEDLTMYFYPETAFTIPGQPVVPWIHEGLEYFDAVWSISSVSPQYLAVTFMDLL